MSKCQHDYIFLDKWQDSEYIYWEFACRFCLTVIIRRDKNEWKEKQTQKIID